MSQSLRYDEGKFEKCVSLEEILITLDDSDSGFCLKYELRYPHKIKKQIVFHLLLKRKLNLKMISVFS